MNSASARERKRAKDRESQRVSRIRTKAYISHLETEIAELRQSSTTGNSLAGTVEKQFAHLRKESETLQRALDHIGRLVKDASQRRSGRTDDGAVDSASRPQSLNSPNVEGQRHENNGRDRRDCPSKLDESTATFPQVASSIDPYQVHVLHGISPSDPAAQVVLADFFKKPMADEPNMFISLNNMISILQHQTIFFVRSEDDDTCIRAVLHGWETLASRELDAVWTAIQALDRMIFRNCAIVERVAMVRLLRLVLLSMIDPTSRAQQTLPPYLQLTKTQTSTPHPPVIDILVWPSLRDLLIITGCQHVTQQQVLKYAQDLVFEWPFEIRDIYKKDVKTGQHAFSKDLDERFFAADAWSMREEGRCQCVFQRHSGSKEPGTATAGGIDGICVLCDLDLPPDQAAWDVELPTAMDDGSLDNLGMSSNLNDPVFHEPLIF